jgi:hypothetical protein
MPSRNNNKPKVIKVMVIGSSLGAFLEASTSHLGPQCEFPITIGNDLIPNDLPLLISDKCLPRRLLQFVAARSIFFNLGSVSINDFCRSSLCAETDLFFYDCSICVLTHLLAALVVTGGEQFIAQPREGIGTFVLPREGIGTPYHYVENL